MARSGVLKSKKAAQDGNREKNDGTVEERVTNEVYPYTNQNVGGATVGSNVTFEVAVEGGNATAVDIAPA